MHTSISHVQDAVQTEINQITRDTIHRLTNLWERMFERDNCTVFLKKLTDHVHDFYNEIVEETENKEKAILSEIKNLHAEASTLKRLLNVEIELNPQKGIPFHTVQMVLDESLQSLRDQLQKRKDEISELLLEQEGLCSELGEPIRELLDDPLPTATELAQFREYLDGLNADKNNRISEVAQLRQEIKRLLSVLEFQLYSDSDIILLNDRLLPLTRMNIIKLREMHSNFNQQAEELKESITSHYSKLENLWNFLDVEQSIREKFRKYKDINQSTYDRINEELKRCEAEKRLNLKKFIDKLRDEILLWWEKTMKSELEKCRFSNFNSELYTEDLLALYEMELDDLKTFYNNNESIFHLINERKTLWERMMALEKKASEPGRYNNRGGQLLKEEKERKTIASKLPKIEAELVELVQTYEKRHKKRFLMYGECVEDVIMKEWEKKKEEKEKLMSARKKALGTPLTKVNLIRTPLTARSNSTTIKSVASTTKISTMPSLKRKLPLPDNLGHAKRSILGDLNSPNTFQRPEIIEKGHFKPPLKKKIFGSLRSSLQGRRSSGKEKRRSGRLVAKGHKPPRVIITACDTDTASASDSVSYENFEEYIESRSPCRSSIMAAPTTKIAKKKTPIRSKMTARLIGKVNVTSTAGHTPLPKTPRQLARTNSMVICGGSGSGNEHKSMMTYGTAGLSRTKTPSPGTGKRMTTKNLPIII